MLVSTGLGFNPFIPTAHGEAVARETTGPLGPVVYVFMTCPSRVQPVNLAARKFGGAVLEVKF